MTDQSGRHSVSVAAVVTDDAAGSSSSSDATTALGRSGGFLELQESTPDGVRREIAEKTGLVVKVDRPTSVYKERESWRRCARLPGCGGRRPGTAHRRERHGRLVDARPVAGEMQETFAVRVLVTASAPLIAGTCKRPEERPRTRGELCRRTGRTALSGSPLAIQR